MNKTPYCGNADSLVSYLYGEGDAGERRAFEAHLSTCTSCAREVADFRAVRTDLASWAPPDTLLDFRVVRGASGRRSWLSWPAMPVWAQLGAAAMLVGMAVGVSGLEVRSDDRGVTVRTRWAQPAAAPVTAAASARPEPVAAGADAPWRAELGALEQRLRRELRPEGAATVAASAQTGQSPSDDEILARVRQLIDASESRQQRDMALRLAQALRDVEAQRRADLVRVADGLGFVEGRTGAEVARQREMLNYLMRVSSQRDPR